MARFLHYRAACQELADVPDMMTARTRNDR
jgi:hypothetical protein